MRARLPLSVIFGLLITLLTQSSYANELLIWDKLEGSAPKGYVLLLRHTLAPGVGDPENFKLTDCATQRNLSEVGRQDAKEVGEWLKRRELKIFRVESSRWCRAKETAQLLVSNDASFSFSISLFDLFSKYLLLSFSHAARSSSVFKHPNSSGFFRISLYIFCISSRKSIYYIRL